MRVPSTTPPTSPAAAVAMPVMTAAFDEPFELAWRALEPPLRALDPPLRELELPLPEFELRLREPELPLRELGFRALLAPEDRDDELRPRDDADAVRLLDALPLLALVLPELPSLALDPFELLDDLRFVPERALLWAMAPP
jgi:hypothetical protein